MTSRRAYACVAVGLLVFTVYVSLLPFHLEPVAPSAAWQQFAGAMTTWPARLPRANFLANLLLFVPIGFGLAGARLAGTPPGHSRRAAFAGAVAASVAVSLLAEFLQVFAPGRVVSSADVVAQTLGCVCGLAVWAVSGQALTSWLYESGAHTNHDRLTRVLVGYVWLWAFTNLAPFDITLDPEALAARVRQGSIAVAPFSQPFTLRLLWDVVVTTVGDVPLGMLAVSGWWTRTTRRDAFTATALGIGGVAIIEAAQVFIHSHAADATDVLCGAVGVVGGVLVGTRLWGSRSLQPARGGDGSPWAWAGLGLWCLMVAAYHWQPFDFGMDEDLVRRKVARLSLVPFAGYGAGSDLAAFNNLLAKVATALPLGLIGAFALPRGMSVRLAVPLWVACSGMLFSVVEAGQLFVPSRAPDPTDVSVGVAASLAGLGLGRWLRAGYRAAEPAVLAVQVFEVWRCQPEEGGGFAHAGAERATEPWSWSWPESAARQA
jgi:VanZ family protein